MYWVYLISSWMNICALRQRNRWVSNVGLWRSPIYRCLRSSSSSSLWWPIRRNSVCVVVKVAPHRVLECITMKLRKKKKNTHTRKRSATADDAMIVSARATRCGVVSAGLGFWVLCVMLMVNVLSHDARRRHVKCLTNWWVVAGRGGGGGGEVKYSPMRMRNEQRQIFGVATWRREVKAVEF